MRKCVRGVSLIAVAFGLAGCAVERSPQVVIAPSYSYVQADLAAGVTPDTQSHTVLTSLSRVDVPETLGKLPPLPEAPGFDTLVWVPTDRPMD